ncbi:MAG: HEAT repeat domain-containing protein, partial [Dehalococcoidia bacterium]|nr:HEAT repeat domain-containing protein [Dehalococcoidia bacterium]
MRASQWIGIVTAAIVVVGSAGIAAGPAQQEERRSVDGLVYDLQHPEADRRIRAARLLGQNKVHAAVPALMEAATDRDEDVRLEAAKSLVLIHDRRARPTYVLLTRDTNPVTQEKAVEGIINTYVGDESGFIQGLQ